MGTLELELLGTPERFAMRGMTCGSCARHVEKALQDVSGVRSVRVDLATKTATVVRDPTQASVEALREAVAEAGYELGTQDTAEASDFERDASRGETLGEGELSGMTLPTSVLLRPIGFGMLASLGLLALYLGAITLAQGWSHAIEQLLEDRYFVGALSLGFGTQVGLLAYLRGLHGKASKGGLAASSGTSATAMLACCAHHLTEVLPILGLSGATAFVGAYKAELLWLGLGMNLIGIAYVLWRVRAARRMDLPEPRSDSAMKGVAA